MGFLFMNDKTQRKERGIIMRDWEVRAIREGRKTQFRRLVKSQRHPFGYLLSPEEVVREFLNLTEAIRCPYGQPGDQLWVRETFTLTQYKLPVYRADARDKDGKLWPSVHSDPNGVLWTPSIHMPRWASRITLAIVSVRAQRLKDITEEDAKAEGAEFGFWHQNEGVFTDPVDEEDEHNSCFRDGFGFLWELINGPGSWERNDFVFAVEFKEVKS